MSEADLINRLIGSGEYQALTRLRSEFNLFGLLDDALREPAWSRLFSAILDSTLPHGLGIAAFREWFALVSEEQGSKRKAIPAFFFAVPQESIIRTSVEYATPAGRRVDILVRILDLKHRVLAVVGIENKLESPEQPSQISDYQAALIEMFPDAYRLIVYLTPDRREPQTANSLSNCPYVAVSYRTMVAACRKLDTNVEPKVGVLLQSLANEIETVVLGEDKMKSEAIALIKKLWADPDHRKAMKLIIECIPTPRKLWETGLVKSIDTQAMAIGFQFNVDSITYYPERSVSPHEIKIWCGGKVGDQASNVGFHLCYMLHSGDRNPDIGSEFSLRLMAWCDSPKSRQRLTEINLEQVLPAGGARKNWSSWVNVWTGESYALQELGTADLEGLANLVLDGVRRTFPQITQKLAKIPPTR